MTFLKPHQSILLGLTCRKFYALHWELYGKVKIDVSNYELGDKRTWEWLIMYHYLGALMGEYRFDVGRGCYVKAQGRLRGG
jgi:hypothetical protein